MEYNSNPYHEDTLDTMKKAEAELKKSTIVDSKNRYKVAYDIKKTYPYGELNVSFTALFFCILLSGLGVDQASPSDMRNPSEDITLYPG